MQNFANCFKWLQKVILTSHHTSNARLPNGLNHIIHASNSDGAIRREESIAQVSDFTASHVTWSQIIVGISIPAIGVIVGNLFGYFMRISRDNAVRVEVSSGTASTTSEDSWDAAFIGGRNRITNHWNVCSTNMIAAPSWIIRISGVPTHCGESAEKYRVNAIWVRFPSCRIQHDLPYNTIDQIVLKKFQKISLIVNFEILKGFYKSGCIGSWDLDPIPSGIVIRRGDHFEPVRAADICSKGFQNSLCSWSKSSNVDMI